MAVIVLVVTLTAYSKISNVKIPYLSGHRIWICKCLSDFSLIVGEHNWIHDILYEVHHLRVRSAMQVWLPRIHCSTTPLILTALVARCMTLAKSFNLFYFPFFFWMCVCVSKTFHGISSVFMNFKYIVAKKSLVDCTIKHYSKRNFILFLSSMVVICVTECSHLSGNCQLGRRIGLMEV